jgi:hypothetical protein
MSFERRVTTTTEPALISGIMGWNPRSAKEPEEKATGSSSALVREAIERENALLRALSGTLPRADLPQIKAPVLSDDDGRAHDRVTDCVLNLSNRR